MFDVRGLHSFYGDAHVIQGVDLNVNPGEVVCVLGRNGMGKSTLIRSIMGLQPPTVREGKVTWKDNDITRWPSHKIAQAGIAIVPQGRRLFASLTVTEHLTVLKPASVKSGWTVEKAFEFFPRLAERRRHRGEQLSGGERQMMAIARALMVDPQLILMDEPSEGLAPVMVQALENIILELKQAGLSILLVEQNVYSALAVSDRIYVLESGCVVYEEACEAVRQTPGVLSEFLGVH